MADSKPTKDTAELLRHAAEDVLKGSVFQRSKANSEMLTYLLAETYAGRADAVSEYSIAIDLLGRGGDFDPSVDPIVRVRMRRLRDALQRHYALSDGASAVKLVLPKGRYLLHAEVLDNSFDRTSLSESDHGAEGKFRMGAAQWASFLFLSLSACVTVWSFWQSYYGHVHSVPSSQSQTLSSYPVIDIPAFQNVTGVDAFDRYERDFQLQLAADIENFDRLRVRVMSLEAPNPADDVLPRFRIAGSILDLTGTADVFVALMDVETDTQVFSKRFSVTVDEGDVVTALATVADIVSGHIVGQNGAISQFYRDKVTGEAQAQSLGVFRCVLLTDVFLASLRPQDHQAARHCFGPFVEQGLEDPVAAASWGLLLFHAVPEFHLMSFEGMPKSFYQTPDEVLQYAENLVDRFPSSASAFLLVGAVHSAGAQPLQAISSLQRSVDLNGADPTALSVLSYAYMATDQHRLALDAARRAIRESANPPPFMYVPVLVGAVVLGDAEQAYEAAENVARQHSPGTDTALLVAAQMAGDKARVEALRPQVEALDYPMQGLDVFVRGEKAVRAFLVLLAAAGIPLR